MKKEEHHGMWRVTSHKFVIPEDELIDMNDPIIMEMVIYDVNSDKIKINSVNARYVNMADDFLSFIYIFYKTEKTGNTLGSLLVWLLTENLPNVLEIEIDGYKYLHMDVRQRSIRTKRQ